MLKLKYLTELLLSVSLILLRISPTLSEIDGRIVNGVTTTIAEAPYLVQLRSNEIIFCAGTLVSEYFVISAAHCVAKNRPNMTVVGGATRIFNDAGSAQSTVSGYVFPDTYTFDTSNMDVAVIKLHQPLVGALIKPIAMGCDKWKDGDVVKVFGWGQTDEKISIPSIQLQSVEINIVEQGWCKWLYTNRRVITEYMFCAAADGKDTCYGDSGGTAIVNNQFCGVISFGGGCAHNDSPGVYANLRKLAKYVKRAMKKLDETETESKGLAKFVRSVIKIMMPVNV